MTAAAKRVAADRSSDAFEWRRRCLRWSLTTSGVLQGTSACSNGILSPTSDFLFCCLCSLHLFSSESKYRCRMLKTWSTIQNLRFLWHLCFHLLPRRSVRWTIGVLLWTDRSENHATIFENPPGEAQLSKLLHKHFSDPPSISFRLHAHILSVLAFIILAICIVLLVASDMFAQLNVSRNIRYP